MERIKNSITESMQLKQQLLENTLLLATVEEMVTVLVAKYKQGQRVFLCGNGGSASDAQHIAAEFTGRFYYDRAPLYAEALHVNTSYMTAVANDYSFEEVYARLIQCAGKPGDVLWAISTSGNSKNILNALERARQLGLTTFGFTGEGGGKMRPLCDYLIDIPSRNTARIQELHILIGHIICESVESQMYPR